MFYTLEEGIDVLLTAKGTGYSLQTSMLMRFYHIADDRIPELDELQIGNRMRDIPKIIEYEKRHLTLAIWGPEKKGREGTQAKRRGLQR